jgi:ubiquitin-protein ligase
MVKEIFLIFKQTLLGQVKSFSIIINHSTIPAEFCLTLTKIVGTSYEGGIFKCKLVIDSEFPQKPPKGK